MVKKHHHVRTVDELIDEYARLDKLMAEYTDIEQIARRFSEELVRQLSILIDSENVNLGFPVEARVKSWESISEKIRRLSLTLNSVMELQDLIGIRLILLFRRDAERICNAIARTFQVCKAEDTTCRLKEDQFGYASVHFIVQVPDEWLVVPALSSFAGLRAEIQVRTVAQHLWAAASHVLQYKKEANIPEPVRRSIHRVSALLETADLEFERVLEAKHDYRRDLSLNELGRTLNADNVEKILDSLLPTQNKGANEDYEELLSDLRHFDIDAPQKLEKLIADSRDDVLQKEEQALSRAMEDESETYHEDYERVLEKGVYFTHSGLTRCALGIRFGKKWDHYIRRHSR